jgi:uncharacterized protein (TIGR03083 family)
MGRVTGVELDHLVILRRELAAFHRCLGGDLTAPVPHCGAWTVRDLAEHLGQGNLWAATAVTDRRGDADLPPAPDDIGAWFGGTARLLTEVLAVEPGTEAWTFAPPHTVGFWRRRRCLETLVHRWDAEHALGLSSDLDPALCGDGIAEVIDTFLPRQIRLGRCAELPAAVRLTATDLDGSWVLGPGEPVAGLAAGAAEIMLALWNRRPVPWHQLTGDEEAARQVFSRALVP